MTEKEFLEKRIPIWLEGEDLHIATPSNPLGILFSKNSFSDIFVY